MTVATNQTMVQISCSLRYLVIFHYRLEVVLTSGQDYRSNQADWIENLVTRREANVLLNGRKLTTTYPRRDMFARLQHCGSRKPTLGGDLNPRLVGPSP